jgi:hypothetical protein
MAKRDMTISLKIPTPSSPQMVIEQLNGFLEPGWIFRNHSSEELRQRCMKARFDERGDRYITVCVEGEYRKSVLDFEDIKPESQRMVNMAYEMGKMYAVQFLTQAQRVAVTTESAAQDGKFTVLEGFTVGMAGMQLIMSIAAMLPDKKSREEFFEVMRRGQISITMPEDGV